MADITKTAQPELQQQDAGPSNIDRRDARRLRRRELVKKKVKQLELKLADYDRQIRRVMEMELTMDDMDSDTSPYLMEDVLKRKFMRTWYQLCNLLHIDPDIKIQQERDGGYSGTRYPQINRRIERLLSLDEFPDHFDICQVVERVNDKYSLGIGKEERVAISRKVFKEVGAIIQQRRQNEFKGSFGCHLTDDLTDEGDPARSDEALQKQLEKSVVEGEERLAQICEQFAVRQETEGDATGTSEEEERGGGSEEEEERNGGGSCEPDSGEGEEPLAKRRSSTPPQHIANGEALDEETDIILHEDTSVRHDREEEDDLVELISSPAAPCEAAVVMEQTEDAHAIIVISDSDDTLD